MRVIWLSLGRSLEGGGVLEVDRARVGGELRRVLRLDRPTEADGIDVLLVDVDRVVAVEAALHPVDVADRGDAVGRGVDAALQDQGVADTADGARRDDPLV